MEVESWGSSFLREQTCEGQWINIISGKTRQDKNIKEPKRKQLLFGNRF